MFFEYQYALTSQFVVGVAGGFNKFSYDTYTEGTVSISGLQYRYTNSFPIVFTFDYFYDTEATLTPFAGFGLGTIYSDRRVDIGLFETKIQEWQFVFSPKQDWYTMSVKALG
jgi:outer membrane protein